MSMIGSPKQIFGWTPVQAPEDPYVRFVALFENANSGGDLLLQIRNTRGEINEIVLPREVATMMADAMAAAANPDVRVKQMVDRFLAWKLPENFFPDCGISFDKSKIHPASWPTGTNLLDATQATAMVRHMLGSA
jgi:hypothetical protein